MIILLGSYKGGCGKSTLATSIAAMLATALTTLAAVRMQADPAQGSHLLVRQYSRSLRHALSTNLYPM